MLRSTVLCELALLLGGFYSTSASQQVQEHLLITAPPTPQATQCPQKDVLKRQAESCQYGQCGTTCLEQGAFCCGPAGSLATSPFWVCDNGACITSVRGITGIVDCYDPDNPSGTTQSCLDEKATTSCALTDRCFRCTADQPYCQWETYIESNSPTLSWFTCVETKDADLTFYASTTTGKLPSNTKSTGTASSTAHSDAQKNSPLSTGAIIGIAVGGGVAVVGSVAVLAYCCLRRKRHSQPPQELDPNAAVPQMFQPEPVLELDAPEYTRSEIGGSTAAYSPSTPFTPSEGYGRNVEELDMWRRGSPTTRTDQQVKDWYSSQVQQPPRELHEGRRE